MPDFLDPVYTAEVAERMIMGGQPDSLSWGLAGHLEIVRLAIQGSSLGVRQMSPAEARKIHDSLVKLVEPKRLEIEHLLKDDNGILKDRGPMDYFNELIGELEKRAQAEEAE